MFVSLTMLNKVPIFGNMSEKQRNTVNADLLYCVICYFKLLAALKKRVFLRVIMPKNKLCHFCYFQNIKQNTET